MSPIFEWSKCVWLVSGLVEPFEIKSPKSLVFRWIRCLGIQYLDGYCTSKIMHHTCRNIAGCPVAMLTNPGLRFTKLYFPSFLFHQSFSLKSYQYKTKVAEFQCWWPIFFCRSWSKCCWSGRSTFCFWHRHWECHDQHWTRRTRWRTPHRSWTKWTGKTLKMRQFELLINTLVC